MFGNLNPEGSSNPDADRAAAKLRSKVLSDPRTGREAKRHYSRDDKLAIIAKAFLFIGLVALIVFLLSR